MGSKQIKCVVCAEVRRTLKSLQNKSIPHQNLNQSVRVRIVEKALNARTATMAQRTQMVMGVRSKLRILNFAGIKIKTNSHQVKCAACVNQLTPELVITVYSTMSRKNAKCASQAKNCKLTILVHCRKQFLNRNRKILRLLYPHLKKISGKSVSTMLKWKKVICAPLTAMKVANWSKTEILLSVRLGWTSCNKIA